MKVTIYAQYNKKITIEESIILIKR